jgi:maleylacetoacetate isomerase
MTLKLYSYWRSSAAYRVRIALNLKQLPFQTVAVDLRTGQQHSADVHERNPQHLVPLLVDGERSIRQSMAIIEYLDETHDGRGYRLIPVEVRERARVRALADVIGCDIHPLNNLRVLAELGSRFGADQSAKDDWMRHWMRLGLDAFEALLAGNPSTGAFCEGDEPTMADCLLIPQLYNARRFGMDISVWPTVARIERSALVMDEFAAARPEAQPDADPA